MGRRFPTPLLGIEDTEARSALFVFIAIESTDRLDKSAFVDRVRDRLRKPDGELYSESYVRRTVSTYVQLGVLCQTSDGTISVWKPAHAWYDGEIDFQTFLWYAIKRSWVLEGEFPEGIEGLHHVHSVVKRAEEPISKGEIEDRLAEEYDYEFNDSGIRGYPGLLEQLGAIESVDGGYTATEHQSRYANRFRNTDLSWQLERWLKREGPNAEPPSDRVKRDLMKYYMYRESGGWGRHRQLLDTVRADYLSRREREEDSATPQIRRAEKYLERERRRQTLRDSIVESFESISSTDLSGLSTAVLKRIASADDFEEAQRIIASAGRGISRADLEAMHVPERPVYAFPPSFSLYSWQAEAAARWFESDASREPETGIVQVVTGAGKTVMALEVVRRWLERHPEGVITVVVPTRVLMHQWLTEFVETLNVPPEDVGWAGGGHKDSFDEGFRILVTIVNSAVQDDFLERTVTDADPDEHLLIADECHRYTGDVFSTIFECERTASLGLSATPLSDPGTDERSAEDRLLLDALGEIYYTLTYAEALERELIPEFRVNYIGFELTPAERETYDRLSRKISDAISEIETRYGHRLHELEGNYARNLQTLMNGADGPTPAIADYFRFTQERRELVADAVARQAITLSLLRRTIDADQKAIVFQERIEQLERMVAPTESRGRNPRTDSVGGTDVDRARLYERYPQLKDVDRELEELFFKGSYRPVMYHSGHRNKTWNDFAIEWFREDGFANVMLSVKALIEGVDVPSADVGIVRVSSGSVRQRIQTLGRVLRTGGSADCSELYVLYARDTVDERIFHEYDWERDLANADVRHLTWDTDDSVLTGALREATPEEIPEPPDRPTIPSVDDLERGDAYDGPYGGYRCSVDASGRPFEKTGDGRRYITNESLRDAAEYVHRRKGGGVLYVNEANHAVTIIDGEATFVGVVDSPDEFVYDDRRHSSLTDDDVEFDELF